MNKEKISHLASVGIIFRASDPSQIFIEIKDDGFPTKVFRRCLNCIGGNWIGVAGKHDRGPLDTFRREINEELSAESAITSTLELKLLGYEPKGNFYRTPRKENKPSCNERKTLEELKKIITGNCTPFGDFKYQIPEKVFLKADPENKKEGFTVVVSYWLIALSEEWWKKLVKLQKSLGNLSNESITIITSLQEIIEAGAKGAFGQERALQKFFLAFGLSAAHELPLVEGIIFKEEGTTLSSYKEYLDRYDIQRKPV